MCQMTQSLEGRWLHTLHLADVCCLSPVRAQAVAGPVVGSSWPCLRHKWRPPPAGLTAEGDGGLESPSTWCAAVRLATRASRQHHLRLRDFRKRRRALSTRRELSATEERRSPGTVDGLTQANGARGGDRRGDTAGPRWVHHRAKGRLRPAEQVVPSPELTLTPADLSRDVPLSAEVVALVTGGKITAVRLVDDTGTLVRAEPREDGTAWVPTTPLRPQHTYTAAVTATGDSGRTTTRTTTFTTAAASTKPQVSSTLYFRRQTVRHRDAGDRRLRSAHRQGGPRRRAASVVRHHEPTAAGCLVLGGRRQPGLLPGPRLLAAGHDHQCPGRPGGSADRQEPHR